MERNKVFHGDCLEVMRDIPDGSIDMVLCDPPYGTTPLYWDNTLDFNLMWEQYWRIIKRNGTIVVFGNEPFSTMLRHSQLNYYKYDWYWEKERLTNVFQVKRRCGKTVENIMVFYKNKPTYNPQKFEHVGRLVSNKIGENARWSETMAGKDPKTKPFEYIDDGTRYPTQVLRFSRENSRNRLHPTQKPVALCEYLIRTYSNDGETVLDNCAGSFTTAVACDNTNRNWICIEKEEKYCNIGLTRINDNRERLSLPLLNSINSRGDLIGEDD
jgi:site-specific DNA-methyltransferase (adenine-specific)